MAFGQHTIVKGIVTDSVTGEALPSVTIVFISVLRPISTGTFLFLPVRREKCWK